MSLICRLRGHRADPGDARWNEGLCFGRCARCGCDLVRAATGHWRVPRGYRVVWRPAPERVEPITPAPLQWRIESVSEPEASAPEQEAPAPPEAAVSCAGRIPGAIPAAEAASDDPAQSTVPDFMDDRIDDAGWDDFADLPRRRALG